MALASRHEATNRARSGSPSRALVTGEGIFGSGYREVHTILLAREVFTDPIITSLVQVRAPNLPVLIPKSATIFNFEFRASRNRFNTSCQRQNESNQCLSKSKMKSSRHIRSSMMVLEAKKEKVMDGERANQSLDKGIEKRN
ncbi:putative metabotropic glutamate receptor 3 [Sesbania bispinosa]|nr:putative metabotropic glutamate receptor 3 [Sesbania bispinosa]